MSDKTAPAFDIADFEDIPEAEYVLRDPVSNAATGVVFRLGGPEYRPRKRLMQDRLRRMANIASKTGKVPVPDPTEAEEIEVDLLVAATIGWSGLVLGGKPLEYSPAAARDLYSDPKRRWLREQVKAALDDKELFTQRSGAT